MTTVLIDPTLRRARIVRGCLAFLLLFTVGAATIFASGLRGDARVPPPLPSPRKVVQTAGRRPVRGRRPVTGILGRSANARAGDRSEPRPREVIAFVDPSAKGALVSLDRHAEALSAIAATGFLVGDGGAVIDRVDAALLDVARSHQLPTSVLLQNLDEDDGRWRPDRLRALARNAAARRRLAVELERACAKHELRGVHLDLEELEDSDWPMVTQLASELAARLRPQGFEVAVDVPPFLDEKTLRALGRVVDRVVVMAYDEHDEHSAPGPVASSDFVERALAAASVVGSERLTAGLAIYGYDWIDGGPPEPRSFVEAHLAARELLTTPMWDPASGNSWLSYSDESGPHEIWLADAATLSNQLQSAARHAGAIALWRLGGEDPGVWEILQGRGPHALGDVPPDDGVEITGRGAFLSLAFAPEAGRRDVAVADGRIINEAWTQSPSPYLVRRAGAGPKRVAITFDDGPDERYTPAILDTLARTGTPATFFVIGLNVAHAPGLVERAFAEGHAIGNHSFTHPDVEHVGELRLRVELESTSRLVESLTGRRPLLYRPPSLADVEPHDATSAAAFARAGALGYLVVDMDVDPRDWEPQTASSIAERVLSRSTNGGVILLHDGGGDRSATVAALPGIIAGLRARGLGIVPLAELVGKSRDEVMPRSPERPAVAAVADRAIFRGGSALVIASRLALVAALALIVLRTLLMLICAAIAERRRRRRRTGPLPSTTVVVPAFNERDVIARTISSVLASDLPVQLIVVDDGSTDGTAEHVAAVFGHDPRVRLIAQRNGGKAAALRTGFAAADTEVVVALDGDTLFGPDTVRRLVEPFLDPRVGAVAGTAEVGNLENVLTRCQALEYLVQQELERRAWDAFGALPVVPGAVGAWRRRAVAKVGGFSSETLAEDADLAMALCRAGWRVVHAPDARARTEAPSDVRGLFKQRVRWSFGVMQALWKHRRALVERNAGAFGRIVLPTMILFQVLLPLLAPFALVALSAAAVAGNWRPALFATTALTVAEWLQTAIACWFDRRGRWRLMLWLPAARVIYRPILWLVTARSLARVLDGIPLGWGKLARRGTVSP